MKFLVLALCVCAASAASFGYKPFQQYQSKAFAQVSSAPQTVASAVYEAPKVAYEAAKFVAAAPVVAAKTIYTAGKEAESAILRSDSDVAPDGFKYSYETSNGISAEANGFAKKVNNEDAFVVQGSYRYVAPDGTPVQVTYVADENGYQPQSDSIPVAPPVPELIARSLEYLRAHPPQPEKIY